MSGQGRIADGLLRSLGGRTVLLRMPGAAVPGDLGEQVGLAAPLFEDLELGPVVWRKVRAKIATAETERAAEYELLVSATAVKRLVGSLAFQSASVLFGQAAGVLVDGVLMQITSATSAEAFGAVYLYRLGLKGPDALLV